MSLGRLALNRHSSLWCLVGFALSIMAAGCAPKSSTPEASSSVVRIYSSLPRTGSAKGQTDSIVNGIRLAIDEVQGKAGPFTLDYVDLDDATAAANKWTTEQETANAERAINDPDAMAYIGTHNSGAAKVAMPILNKGSLLMVSPSNTWPGLTKPGLGEAGEPERYFQATGRRNYVRVVPTDDLQARRSAEWAKSMGVKSVYIIDDKEVYGAGIANLFEDFCDDVGIKVLGHESIDVNSQEFKGLMTTIKARNPDLIYFGGTTQTQGGQLAKDMVAAGLDSKMMAPDGCFEEAFIDSAGAENLNGRFFVTFGGLPPEKLSGVGQEFVKKYKERHGMEPEAYAIYGYEAARVAIAAIRAAGKKERQAVVDAAFAIKDFEGALGTWSFDANGDTNISTISGNTVENGKFKFVAVLDDTLLKQN
jgi:branched-chain amino acid transport system substrate-binding protein